MSQVLRQLMISYANKGLADWKSAPVAIKNRAKQCLENKIADSEAEAAITIKATFRGAGDTKLKFIPMPKIPDDDGDSYRSFFLPMRSTDEENAETAFDLFVLVDIHNSLGFRFEPADPATHAHSYTHVQFNRKMIQGAFAAAGIPAWMPASYPAFPIRTKGPLQMFLAMATAVHGAHKDGVVQVIREALVAHPIEQRRCMEELAALYA